MTFLYRYKSRQFFTPLLFELLHISSFVAPPLSKPHVVLARDLVEHLPWIHDGS